MNVYMLYIMTIISLRLLIADKIEYTLHKVIEFISMT